MADINDNSIKIVDTGYIKANKTGNIESTIVNSGEPFMLKISSMTYERGVPLDNSPIPGLFPTSAGESTKVVNIPSVDNPQIRIRGVINRRKVVDYDGDLTKESELDFVALFDQLVTTRGLKCIYNEDIYTRTVEGISIYPFQGLIKALGKLDLHNGAEVPIGIKHLHVRIKSIRFTEEPNALINFEMMLEVSD